MAAKLLLALLCCAALLAGCKTAMKGVSSLEAGNVQQAISEFQAELAANPANWQAREMLGYAYVKADEPQKAIAELEKTLSQEPKLASMSYVYLGWAQLKLDKQEAALATWAKFDDPSKPLVKEELGRLSTLVEIELSKKMARRALASEAQRSVVATKPNSIAVFNFAIVETDKTLVPLQKALTAMTISDLAQVKTLSVIERTRLQALLDEMKLGESGAVDAATAPKAGKMLGAEKLVVGSLKDASGKLGVASSVASTAQGDVLGSFGLSQARESFFALQKQVVENIIKVNKITLDPETARIVLQEGQTRSFKAVVMFGQGLDALDRQDWLAAKDYFALAVKEDPSFMLARLARDRAPVGISIRVGAQPVSSVVGERVQSAYNAQMVLTTPGITPRLPVSTTIVPTTPTTTSHYHPSCS